MYAHTRKKTGDTVNFYNKVKTQTEKVNKRDYFTEAWQLSVRVVNADFERSVERTNSDSNCKCVIGSDH
jgi:hypothetical protein